MAFLETLSLEERRRAILQYDRALAEECRRLKAGAPLPQFRREARRVALERVESTRRSLRILIAVAGTPASAGSASRTEEKKK